VLPGNDEIFVIDADASNRRLLAERPIPGNFAEWRMCSGKQ
jgi:hypothetical protein